MAKRVHAALAGANAFVMAVGSVAALAPSQTQTQTAPAAAAPGRTGAAEPPSPGGRPKSGQHKHFHHVQRLALSRRRAAASLAALAEFAAVLATQREESTLSPHGAVMLHYLQVRTCILGVRVCVWVGVLCARLRPLRYLWYKRCVQIALTALDAATAALDPLLMLLQPHSELGPDSDAPTSHRVVADVHAALAARPRLPAHLHAYAAHASRSAAPSPSNTNANINTNGNGTGITAAAAPAAANGSSSSSFPNGHLLRRPVPHLLDTAAAPSLSQPPSSRESAAACYLLLSRAASVATVAQVAAAALSLLLRLSPWIGIVPDPGSGRSFRELAELAHPPLPAAEVSAATKAAAVPLWSAFLLSFSSFSSSSSSARPSVQLAPLGAVPSQPLVLKSPALETVLFGAAVASQAGGTRSASTAGSGSDLEAGSDSSGSTTNNNNAATADSNGATPTEAAAVSWRGRVASLRATASAMLEELVAFFRASKVPTPVAGMM
jgi:hypothetical protein